MSFLLSDTERRVLYALEHDARRSFANIAEQLTIPKETVKNCVHRLELRGIIQGYMCITNIALLGLHAHAIFVQLQHLPESKRQRVLAHLKAQPEVYWIASLGGRFDFVFALCARDVLDLHSRSSKIMQPFARTIRSTSVVTRVDVSQFRRNYLVAGKKTSSPSYFGRSFAQSSLDGTDRKLLNMLSTSARISLVELASKLGISRITAQRRISVLEEKGIIQSYTPLVAAQNYSASIYQLLIKLQHTSKSILSRIRTFAAQTSGVVFFIHVIGPWDVELSVEVSSQQELNLILGQLRENLDRELISIEVLITFDACIKYALGVNVE